MRPSSQKFGIRIRADHLQCVLFDDSATADAYVKPGPTRTLMWLHLITNRITGIKPVGLWLISAKANPGFDIGSFVSDEFFWHSFEILLIKIRL